MSACHNGKKTFIYEDKSQASRYIQHRPVYPEQIMDVIYDFLLHDKEPRRTIGTQALDLACGSGQCTKPLSKRFQNVTGVDFSHAQIREASQDVNKPENVSYRVGPAEDLSFQPDESVDLITVACAAHWLDQPTLFKEAHRVLKKGGVLAMFAYTYAAVDNPTCSNILQELYSAQGEIATEKWYSEEENLDENIDMPFETCKSFNDLHFSEDGTMEKLLGFVESWSIFQAYVHSNPGTDILRRLENRLLNIYEEEMSIKPGTPLSKIPVHMTYPVYMKLGRK